MVLYPLHVTVVCENCDIHLNAGMKLPGHYYLGPGAYTKTYGHCRRQSLP